MSIIGTEFKPKLVEKRWDISKEIELLKTWEKENRFKTKIEEGKPIIVIDTPPPYMSGRMHIGQIVGSYAQVDMIVRFFRMRGYNVIFPFYADRNGLPVEVQVEKMYGIDIRKVGREEFLKVCKQILDDIERENVQILRRWGISFDYWVNGTDSSEYRKLTQKTFIELWKKGLIYEAERPTPWCPRCRTALAEAEIEYIEEETYLNYIKFKVVETGEEIIIATTRPELLPACVAIIYNPQDERYKKLLNKHAQVPIFNQVVPILEHSAARMEFGTGLVMICTFGDIRDLMIVNELKLPIKIVINDDGTLNKNATILEGLSIKDAREKIIQELESKGLIIKKEKIKHTVPVCWRCKTPVEIIVTKEYFLKQLEFKDELIKLVNERMEFYPSEYKRLLIEWIKSLEFDWPISRRRYYATEIPIWYCIDENGNKIPLLPEAEKYYRPWKEEPPKEIKEKCKTGKIIGEDRVLDTWFDSSITWMYASGYTKPEINVFNKVYPNNIIRVQGYDIIRTWLYYSLLRAYLLFGDVPFKYVRINGMGLDEKGEAMHKSKGNIVDSIPVIEKYGADAVRFWAAASSKLGSDYRYNEQMIKTGHDFVVKLWNIARFVSTFPEISNEDEVKLLPLDLMILGKLNDVIRKVINSYMKFDVYEAIHELFEFTWHIFADHYLEAIKSRAYNKEKIFNSEEQKGAWFTLHKVLKTILKLLAPIMPFVTDYIWRVMYGKSIHDEIIEDPNPKYDTEYKNLIDLFMKFNSSIWIFKNRQGISLAAPLNYTIYAPIELKPLYQELKLMHKIKEIIFEKPKDKELVKISDEIEVYIVKE